MDEKQLQAELQQQVRQSLLPLFNRYELDYADLESVLKWKPIVLVIGNYSSGKSTLINELIGASIQRTGQAPTDDSFTILTAYGQTPGEREVPGATLVNDETLPFGKFKSYGEQFIAHFRLKKVEVPFLENMALIDSPGMLDAVTEKDRGYDYLAVLGEFAKLADLVVLMFDPHKAGTISETYTAIRSTLPETSGEDRIVYVMSRIDECDNLSDLVRSYGTLCWNLSQMTGRKDIPTIYVTYAPEAAREPAAEILSVWRKERELLKQKIFSAPGFRVNHILQHIDRQVNELQLVCEAMNSFSSLGREALASLAKFSLVAAVAAFFLTGPIIQAATGIAVEPLITPLLTGRATMDNLLLPLAGVAVVGLLSWLWFTRWRFPQLIRKCRARTPELVKLDSSYRQNLWIKMEASVDRLLAHARLLDISGVHRRNLERITRFLATDLQHYYGRIR